MEKWRQNNALPVVYPTRKSNSRAVGDDLIIFIAI